MKFLNQAFTILFSFVLGIAATIFALNMAIEHLAGGYLLNQFNAKAPKAFNRNIKAGSIGVSILNGEIKLRDITIENNNAAKALEIPSCSLKISISDLIKNRIIIEKVLVENPVLLHGPSTIPGKDSVLSYISGLRGLGIGPRNLYVQNGTFSIEIDSATTLKVFSNFNLSIENLPVDDITGVQAVKVNGSANIPSLKPGTLNLVMDFTSLSPKYNFEGEFKAIDIFIPYFTSFSDGKADVKVREGNLSLKTNIHCSKDWVTASSIISMNNLDLDITSKKIFGIPADIATEFLKANDVTFDLPVSGDINNLKFDFRTSATQVMFKALQGRFKSDAFTKNISEKFGENIGEKLEEIFSKLL